MEQVGYLETPHVGEWGYDYEIDGIYGEDILVTRACGPPHEIRFWGLENIVTMEVGDIQPLKEQAQLKLLTFIVFFLKLEKEIIIDSGLEWALFQVFFRNFNVQNLGKMTKKGPL